MFFFFSFIYDKAIGIKKGEMFNKLIIIFVFFRTYRKTQTARILDSPRIQTHTQITRRFYGSGQCHLQRHGGCFYFDCSQRAPDAGIQN